MAAQAHQNPLQQLLDPQALVRGFQTLLRTVEWAADQARNGNAYEDSSQREGNGSAYQRDQFLEYEEETLADGRILRRYPDGRVRLENPASGVVQEEGADGSLTVSLPIGKLIYQQYRGEPLLVYDSSGRVPPQVAQVSSVSMPGLDEPAFMFHFQDPQGTHLVELETLRYYRLNRAF